MPETYTVTKVKHAGTKPNPHGKADLHKLYCTFTLPDEGEWEDVYWQSTSSHEPGEEVYGDINKEEFGLRFRTAQKTDQRPDGNFKRPNLKPPVPDPQAERSRRIERQHSQEMSLRLLTATGALKVRENTTEDDIRRAVRDWTDFFAQDLDAEVGGGIGRGCDVVVKPHPTADLSAEPFAAGGTGPTGLPEAPPQLKRDLTILFNKAQIAKPAQKAIVLYRCRSEKATKDGASQLIQDLTDGATHDSLLAEIHDAARSGDPLAIRAAKLIPTDMPNDESWVDDGSLPPVEDESNEPAPF